MAEDWGAAAEDVVVTAPEVQDIKLFNKWSTDDVQVSDISLTVSLSCIGPSKLIITALVISLSL